MTASGLKSRPSVRTAARPRPAARALAAAPALAVPAALPRPPQAPARGTLEALLGLLAWWPLPLLLAAIVAVLAWQGWEMMRFRSMAVPGGIAVQTEGTRATITGGRVYVELPVLVSNSTDSPIREVALWARVYACPSAGAQVADCRLLLSAEQD
ncbi:MAG TPA: hypothetical protein VFF98_03420, partial [Novosphingobium sp.]|nr:hypothetical protein [Novosphingobium sp.]